MSASDCFRISLNGVFSAVYDEWAGGTLRDENQTPNQAYLYQIVPLPDRNCGVCYR